MFTSKVNRGMCTVTCHQHSLISKQQGIVTEWHVGWEEAQCVITSGSVGRSPALHSPTRTAYYTGDQDWSFGKDCVQSVSTHLLDTYIMADCRMQEITQSFRVQVHFKVMF